MIIIKSSNQISQMREGGKILARVLNMAGKMVKPGIGTAELDEFVESEIRAAGGFPIFKGYHGFPTALCTSINDEVVHAPAKPNRVLKDGDIVGLDVGMRYPAKNGLVVDTATTVAVGKISKPAKKLMAAAKDALNVAIKKIKPGIKLGDISAAIQMEVEKKGFSVVRDLVGHGVGEKLHEEPQIPNFGLPGLGPIIKTGMTLAIEPMITAGHHAVVEDAKTGAFKTADNSLSAHFEHTILVTEKGCEILTK
ncbi:MAG: type I methionyl aminopeptidase [Patescibacteria group bacterium]|nr:type I methionyl aminopeptidase [Patescibacteria group bacterium]